MDVLNRLRRQSMRQLRHWELAVRGLGNLEFAAAPAAWASLETNLGVKLRDNVAQAVDQLQRELEVLFARYRAARCIADLDAVGHELVRFRNRYLQTETLVDFYGHAVNSRTNPEMRATLRAFDMIAEASLAALLPRLGVPVPPVLTYIDKGLGASILKAGLRLWDGGTVSAVAAIKITYHNRRRVTALLHEAGHQMAHLLRWNEELAGAFERGLQGDGAESALAWAGWSSEIAADCFAFVHSGYAAVSALADVVSGSPGDVFRHLPGDPHPIAWLRVAFGIECCRRIFGRGPWDEFYEVWSSRYDIEKAPGEVRGTVAACRTSIPKAVEIALLSPTRALGNRALTDWIDPERVHPRSLGVLQAEAGPKLYTSSYWVRKEALRIVALTGLGLAAEPERFNEIVANYDRAITTLGALAPDGSAETVVAA